MKVVVGAAAALLALAAAGVAVADESSIHLKDGPDAELVRGACSVCHSADYIQMNSPFLKRTGWEAEVTKMIKVMGAPISEQDIPRIVDYLTKNYGAE